MLAGQANSFNASGFVLGLTKFWDFGGSIIIIIVFVSEHGVPLRPNNLRHNTTTLVDHAHVRKSKKKA